MLTFFLSPVNESRDIFLNGRDFSSREDTEKNQHEKNIGKYNFFFFLLKYDIYLLKTFL